MDTRAWEMAIDQAISFGFSMLWAAILAIAAVLRPVWFALPAGWNPIGKGIVIAFGVIVMLRLLRLVWELPLRLWSYAALLRRSPFGQARWASRRALRRAGMFAAGGLFLGRLRGTLIGADLYRHGEGHLLTVAGAGAGKTTGLVIPALCEIGEGAVIVTDPKAQIASMTARHRATRGPVFYINPFAADLAASTGQLLPDSGFNPLSVLQPGANLKDDAENLARLLMVTDRADSGSYWNDEATGLIAIFLVWMVLKEPEENRTLAFLWQMVRETDAAMAQRLTWLTAQTMPFLRVEGGKLQNLFKVKPQWQGVIAKAQLATQRYAPETPLGEHTAKDGFDLSLLKRQDLTVYLMVPTGRAKVAAPWLNLVIGVMGLAIGKPGPARPVYLLMDEAPALGFLPDLRNHLRESREAGLRAWILTQTKAALADRDLYGENGFRDILGLCDTKTFFSVNEPDLAREIAGMLGERSALNRSRGDTGGADKENLSTVGVPLMRPEAILKMRKGDMLILRTGLDPIRARLVPYWTRRAWAAIVDANPYRR